MIRNLRHTLRSLLVVAFLLALLPGCDFIANFKKEAKEEKAVLGYTKGFNPRIKEIEKILKENGFNSGALDGVMDRETRKAVKSFQGKYKLKETGYVDTATYEKLNSINSEKMKKQQTAQPKVTRKPGTAVKKNISK